MPKLIFCSTRSSKMHTKAASLWAPSQPDKEATLPTTDLPASQQTTTSPTTTPQRLLLAQSVATCQTSVQASPHRPPHWMMPTHLWSMHLFSNLPSTRICIISSTSKWCHCLQCLALTLQLITLFLWRPKCSTNSVRIMVVNITEAVPEAIAKVDVDVPETPLKLEGPSYHSFSPHFLVPFLLLTPAFILRFRNRILASLA